MNHCENHHFGLIANDYNSQTSWLLITEQKGQKSVFAKCHYPQRQMGQNLIPHQECKIVTINKVNLDLTQREVNAPNLNLIRPHSQEAGVIVIVIIVIIIISSSSSR